MTVTLEFTRATKRYPSMNDRVHWSKRSRDTRAWRTAAHVHALRLGPPSKRMQPPSFVRITLPVPDRRRRDPANYTPVTKAIVDGLVDAGMWPDDTPAYVTTLEPILRVSSSPDVIVTITARPEGWAL